MIISVYQVFQEGNGQGQDLKDLAEKREVYVIVHDLEFCTIGLVLWIVDFDQIFVEVLFEKDMDGLQQVLHYIFYSVTDVDDLNRLFR